MAKVSKYWFYVGGGLALFLLFSKSAIAGGTALDESTIVNYAADTIAAYERFDPSPYWDYSRYSWGYGTAAPGPTGTISEAQAYSDLTSFVMSDYNILRDLVTRPLNVNQWGALLDFSYNLGYYNAEALIPYINDNDLATLGPYWLSFNHAGGVVNSNLTARRQGEWQLFNS